jgi:hypothetical protein
MGFRENAKGGFSRIMTEKERGAMFQGKTYITIA